MGGLIRLFIFIFFISIKEKNHQFMSAFLLLYERPSHKNLELCNHGCFPMVSNRALASAMLMVSSLSNKHLCTSVKQQAEVL